MAKTLAVHMKDGRTMILLDAKYVANVIVEKRIEAEGEHEPRPALRCYWNPVTESYGTPHEMRLRYLCRNSIAYIEEDTSDA